MTPTPTGNVTPTPTGNVTPTPTGNVTPTPTVTPPGGDITREIVEGLSGEENLTTFVAAVNNSTIGESLEENGSYVICAPTNDAFAGIDNQTLSVILSDTTLLNTIIGYHVIPGDYTIEELVMLCQNSTDGQISLPTVEGSDVNVSFVNGQLTINNFIVITQIEITNNIVVYVIDGVLIPPDSMIPTPTPTGNVTPTPTGNV
ncbi:fasciclin domain-containing protein, partial [Methanoculleus sp. UBA430]|uniref:fasciclin domain-containing protein n=1 Tax=Methanoculleus sp. UBA430 TaxID=1915511 RepID=UPI0025E2717B